MRSCGSRLNSYKFGCQHDHIEMLKMVVWQSCNDGVVWGSYRGRMWMSSGSLSGVLIGRTGVSSDSDLIRMARPS